MLYYKIKTDIYAILVAILVLKTVHIFVHKKRIKAGAAPYFAAI